MDNKELYALAKSGDPVCIPGLLELITNAALEIMKLQSERDKTLLELKDACKFRDDLTKAISERPEKRLFYYRPKKHKR